MVVWCKVWQTVQSSKGEWLSAEPDLSNHFTDGFLNGGDILMK